MRIHLIAIGGAAMHNLALALSAQGHQVSGSDDEIFEPSRGRLARAGLLPEQMGWDANRIQPDIDAIILGMHARKDNPELQKASALGLSIYSYPAFMASQAEHKTRVVIGGSHGKTTITSMVLHALKQFKIATDYLVGSQLPGFDFMAEILPEAQFALYEGDEYLASALEPIPKFHVYQGHIGCISGIAWDHVNVFPTFENYVAQFAGFIDSLMPHGTLIYNEEDTITRQLVEEHPRKDITFIPYGTPAYLLEKEQFIVRWKEKSYPVSVKGKHNLQNMAAAAQIACRMGVSFENFFSSMASFSGAAKRMEIQHEDAQNAWSVIRDFGHSPSKVAATMQAVAESWPDRQLSILFELHTFSSLSEHFLPMYAEAFKAFPQARIYFSPEAVAHKRLPELSVSKVSDAIGLPKSQIFTTTEQVVSFLKEQPRKQAVWLLMSSGNFGGWTPDW